jgi:hypothetical protein
MATMPNDLQHNWNQFLEGEWTQEPPKETGEYFLADSDGLRTNMMLVVYKTPDGELGYATLGAHSKDFHKVWGGYAWNVPLPALPPVPK